MDYTDENKKPFSPSRMLRAIFSEGFTDCVFMGCCRLPNGGIFGVRRMNHYGF